MALAQVDARAQASKGALSMARAPGTLAAVPSPLTGTPVDVPLHGGHLVPVKQLRRLPEDCGQQHLGRASSLLTGRPARVQMQGGVGGVRMRVRACVQARVRPRCTHASEAPKAGGPPAWSRQQALLRELLQLDHAHGLAHGCQAPAAVVRGAAWQHHHHHRGLAVCCGSACHMPQCASVHTAAPHLCLLAGAALGGLCCWRA